MKNSNINNDKRQLNNTRKSLDNLVRDVISDSHLILKTEMRSAGLKNKDLDELVKHELAIEIKSGKCTFYLLDPICQDFLENNLNLKFQ